MNENLDVYLKMFAVTATWGSTEFQLIFNDAVNTYTDGESEFEVPAPMAETKTDAIPDGVVKGQVLTIRGTDYAVVRIRPDAINPDWSHITLERA